jgi:hypothetical protein
MLKKLLYLGLIGIGINKLSYNLLLKSPTPKLYPLTGKGEIGTLTYNASVKKWVSPVLVKEFEMTPDVRLYHLHDIIATNQSKITLFRPRAYHEQLNMKLAGHGLEVMSN